MRLKFTPYNHLSDTSPSSTDTKCNVIRYGNRQFKQHHIAKATYDHIKNRTGLMYNVVCIRDYIELQRRKPDLYKNFIKGKINEDHVFVNMPVSLWYNISEHDTSDRNYLMLIIITDNILGFIPPEILTRYVTKKDRMEYLNYLDRIFIHEIIPRANNLIPDPNRLDLSIFTSSVDNLSKALYPTSKNISIDDKKKLNKKSIRYIIRNIMNLLKRKK